MKCEYMCPLQFVYIYKMPMDLISLSIHFSHFLMRESYQKMANADPLSYTYSEIPLLRPPKIKTSYPLKTLFAKFKLFFSTFSTPSVALVKHHLWDCPKVVFKITFGLKGGLNIGILLYIRVLFQTTETCGKILLHKGCFIAIL